MEKDFLEKVYGLDNIKHELYLIRQWYLDSTGDEARKRLLPKGIIFHGDPGYGKTHIMREYSKSFDCPIFIIEGNTFKNEDEVVETYKKARQHSLAIVIIDEIDTFVDEDPKLLRSLQAQLDGYIENTSVLTLATANGYEDLPPALLREGRFDRHFLIDNSSMSNLGEIVAGLANDIGIKLDPLSIEELNDEFFCVSTSKIRQTLTSAYLRYGNECSTQQILDCYASLLTGICFLEENKLPYSVFIHEAGHAIYAHLLSEDIRFLRIRFDSKGGKTITRDKVKIQSKQTLLDHIRTSFAGLAAEELILKKREVGSYYDLKHAFKGTSMLLNVYAIKDFSGFLNEYDYVRRSDASEKYKAKIYKKEYRFLNKQYHYVKRKLRKYKKLIVALADYSKEHHGASRYDLNNLIK